MIVAGCIIDPKYLSFSVSIPFAMCLCSNPHLLSYPLTSGSKENASYVINYSSIIFISCIIFSLIHMAVTSYPLLAILGYFKFLDIISKPCVEHLEYYMAVSLYALIIIPLGKRPSHWIVRSTDLNVFNQFLTHKGCVNFRSHQQCIRVSVFHTVFITENYFLKIFSNWMGKK